MLLKVPIPIDLKRYLVPEPIEVVLKKSFPYNIA